MTVQSHRRFPVLPLLLLTICGCSDGEPKTPSVVRFDSVGVEIVESVRPAWGEAEGWHLKVPAQFSIGELEGDDPFLFGEVVGAVRLNGGLVVVGDGQARELRVFDSLGVHLQTFGGPGEGPGEFRSLYRLWRCEGDHLCAFDIRSQVVQVWTLEGENIRTLPAVEPNLDRPRRLWRLVFSPEAEGFLGVGWGLESAQPEEGVIMRTVSPTWLFDGDGGVLLELGEHISVERFARFSSTGGGTVAPHPFGRTTSFALTEDRIFIGTGEALAVSAYDRDGRLTRVIRGPSGGLAISDSILRAYEQVEATEDEARLREMLVEAGMPMPDSVPAYTDIRVDPEGNLWLERFSVQGSQEHRWAVFSNSGEFLGHLGLPPGFRLSDLGTDWILGIHTDELGVERVKVFGLEKG